MPTLILEDGSQVANANTYVELTDYATFLDDHGLTDDRDTDGQNASLISSKDWVDAKETMFGGYRVASTQVLAFPRYGLYLNGFLLASDAIPQQLKNAQMQAAYDSQNSALWNIGSGQAVISEKIDVIETVYSSGGSTSPQNVFTLAEAFLKPLYANGGFMGAVKA